MSDGPRELTPSEKIVFEFHGRAFSEGREEGRLEGLQKGEQRKTREFVSNMLKSKLSDAEICSCIGLTSDELEQVKQTLDEQSEQVH